MAILSISSDFETGALEIGRELRNLLGYKYIGLGGLLDEANRVAKQTKLYDEKAREESMYKRAGDEYISFMALLQSVILEHAAEDNVILLTRGSNYLLKEIPHALRVRFVAPLEYRIKGIMKKEGVSRETARLMVKQADREIDCSIHIGYGKDWDDPEAYEIKFDTSTQRAEEIVEIVKNLLKSKDALKTPEAESLLELRALAARIKAKIVLNPGFYTSTLEMETKGNGIMLRGVVSGSAERKQIEKEVREIAGAIPLICQLNLLRETHKRTSE
jgi:cytidylate kinase